MQTSPSRGQTHIAKLVPRWQHHVPGVQPVQITQPCVVKIVKERHASRGSALSSRRYKRVRYAWKYIKYKFYCQTEDPSERTGESVRRVPNLEYKRNEENSEAGRR